MADTTGHFMLKQPAADVRDAEIFALPLKVPFGPRTTCQRLLLARNDSKNHFLLVAKPHALIKAARVDIVVHNMKKWCLIAPYLETNQLLDEATRETATLEVGVGTNVADLSQYSPSSPGRVSGSLKP